MRFPLLPALLFLLVCIASDRVIYKEIVGLKGRGCLSGAYKLIAILLTCLYMVIVCMPKRNGSDASLRVVMWGLFSYLTIYIPKILFLFFQALSFIPTIVRHKRSRALDIVGAIVAGCVFVVMWWGALFNRTNIEVKNIDVGIYGLPQTFDGLKIAQISDLHLGTFGSDKTFVHNIVHKINSSEPDIVVFTGDLVNRRSREALPFVSVLSGIKAKYGVYAVLGNHDYGDYNDWADETMRKNDEQQLCHLMSLMNWQVLENSTKWIHNRGDSIAIIGVGNISRPPFRVYGDLCAAYQNYNDENIKILLSHNPDHWTDEIMNKEGANIHLTLSGHTHAMQFEVCGLSPASLKYENWGKLSTDTLGRKLYVNIGLGTEGVPFRLGATPEITLITLKAENQ